MKTLKITEEAHKNLIKTQLTIYETTGKKYSFSQILEQFKIEVRLNDKQNKK